MERMEKIGTRAVAALFLLLGVWLHGSAYAFNVSGNLVLPASVNPDGDLQVWVRVSEIGGVMSRQSLITIPDSALPGSSHAFSVINVPDTGGTQWRLWYQCQGFSTGPVPCENVVSRAFYDDDETGNVNYRQDETTPLTGGVTVSGLNMTLLAGNPVSGTVSLPDMDTAPAGGIDFTILFKSQIVSNPFIVFAANYSIAAGSDSVNYTLTLPINAAEQWKAYYQCNDPGGSCSNYVAKGYYQGSVAGTTVETEAAAEALSVVAPLADVDLTMLNGFTIGGTLTVPAAIPTGGMNLRFRASESSNPAIQHEISVSAMAGGTEVPYSIKIPTDEALNWRVSYNCDESSTPLACAPYLNRGYYNSTGTTPTSSSAEILAGGMSHIPVNMTMLEGGTIAGTLSLQFGNAPLGGLSFSVRATNVSGSGGNFVTQVIIAEGTNSTTYAISIDDDVSRQWQISYNCSETITSACANYDDSAYFAGPGMMTTDPNQAVSLTGMESYSGIDLTVTGPDNSQLCVPIKTGSSLVLICL